MCIVVRRVGTRGDRLDLVEHDTSVRVGVALLARLNGRLERHRLDVPVRGFCSLLCSFVIQNAFALLHAPLQLSCEDAQVLVALQRITVGEQVHHNFRSGDPKQRLAIEAN